MKKYTLTLTFIFVSIFCMSTLKANDAQQNKKDSLLKIIPTLKDLPKIEALCELSRMSYDAHEVDNTMFKYNAELFKEAKKQGNIEYQVHAMIDELYNYFNYNRRELFEEKIAACLKFTSENEYWYSYFSAYQTWIQFYVLQNQYDEALAETQKMYEQAKKIKNADGLSSSVFLLGNIYHYKQNSDEAKKFYKECIRLEKQRGVNEWKCLFDAYGNLVIILGEEDINKKEALDVMKEYEKDMITYEESIKHSPELVAGDLTRLLFYYAYLRLYMDSNNIEKIEQYADSMIKYQRNNNMLEGDIITAKAKVEELKGNTRKAYEYYTEAVKLQKGNGGYFSAINNQFNMGRILCLEGKGDEAYAMFKSAVQLGDSILRIETTTQLEELQTIYEVDKLTAEKEIIRQRWIIALVASSLLLILLVVYILYSRRLKRKNESLFQQIQGLSQKEKAVEECLLNRPEESLSKEMKLYQRISKRMKEEKLFTDPDLNRKKLADYLNTNEVYLADAIREGAGETFSSYISDLRLQYTLILLNDHPEMTLDTIAIDSGHGSYSPFYRAFTRKYGITPSEYRKISIIKAKN